MLYYISLQAIESKYLILLASWLIKSEIRGDRTQTGFYGQI